MSDDPIAVLERIEFHLRGMRRAALDADDANAHRAANDALVTVQTALKQAQESQRLTRMTRLTLLRMRHRPSRRRDLQCPATREAALRELAKDFDEQIATWNQVHTEQLAA